MAAITSNKTAKGRATRRNRRLLIIIIHSNIGPVASVTSNRTDANRNYFWDIKFEQVTAQSKHKITVTCRCGSTMMFRENREDRQKSQTCCFGFLMDQKNKQTRGPESSGLFDETGTSTKPMPKNSKPWTFCFPSAATVMPSTTIWSTLPSSLGRHIRVEPVD